MGERGVIGQYPGGTAWYLASGWTFIDPNVPAQSRGRILTWDLHVHGAGTFKIKIFRDDGTNFVFIAEKSLYLAVGSKTGNTWGIAVEKGDLIALYSSSGTPYLSADAGFNYYAKHEDVTTTTLQSSWTTWPGLSVNLRGHIFSKGGIIL